MAVTSSGQVSIYDIMTELGVSGQTSLNDADVRALIGKTAGAQNALNEYYGASNETILTGNHQEITISSYINSGGTLRFQGDWIWSDNTAVAGLIIDIPCTFINEGNVIGRGGNGGSPGGPGGYAGGPAISVTSTGVTIENTSGNYIAGGGGGGRGATSNSSGGGGGGGGAGGGHGANSTYTWGYMHGTPGGAIGVAAQTGYQHNGYGNSADTAAGAGGASGGGNYSRNLASGGQGGGRILPGVGGVSNPSCPNRYCYFGNVAGGSAGNGGGNGSYSQGSVLHASAGGGWGAAGGSVGGIGGGSGAGGKAIDYNSNSVTLTNNGTIYGVTS
jgi:hypothetical protein